jgi:ABC-2 type transport system ATP-binding protein
MPVIEVQALRKRFLVSQKAPGVRGALANLFSPRRVPLDALDGVSFTVRSGELVGYIGVNGSGKSTTIKLLTGILVPSGGEVRVLGRDPHRERVANARDIGAVFGQRSQLWWDLALRDSLELLALIYDLPPARARELLRRFEATLELGELLPRPLRTMSLGQKMRAELAAALLHQPKVLYLDEPTIGLDVVVKDRLRAFIRAANREEGTTVVLTTHDLTDIEELCPRVLLIDRGRLHYDGSLTALKERHGRDRELSFELDRPPPERLPLPEGVHLVSRGERQLVVRFDRARLSAPEVTAALMPRLEVRDFALRETDLADIVKQLAAGRAPA